MTPVESTAFPTKVPLGFWAAPPLEAAAVAGSERAAAQRGHIDSRSAIVPAPFWRNWGWGDDARISCDLSATRDLSGRGRGKRRHGGRPSTQRVASGDQPPNA